MSAPEWVDKPGQAANLDAPLTNGPGLRSPRAMREVIAQFCVETAERYTKNNRGGGTWCNRFVCDVTRALGCPIPFMLANDFADYFAKKGKVDGWTKALRQDVKMAVESGLPVVAYFYNPQGHGHVAMCVQPSIKEHSDAYKAGLIFIAQAGAVNFSEGSLISGFGRNPVTFWFHA